MAAGPIAIIGAGISAAGTIAGGMAQQQAANYEAAQLEVKAEEERAAAGREAGEIRRQRDQILSRQTALASASGFSASDETAQDLAGDVEQEGSYRALMARYVGEERSRGLKAQAAGARASGRAAMTGALFSAAGSFLGGASKTMFDMYGAPGPGGTPGASYLPYPSPGSLY